MNKATKNALEKVFEATVNGRLPFQSRAKIYATLLEEGLVQPLEERMGIATVKGYQLTHLGMLELCTSYGNREGSK